MVSLEKRGGYLESILENEKFRIFYNFLVSNDSSFGLSQGVDTTLDEVFLGILKSIKESNKELFEKYFNQISCRTPSATSPIVNDDYLLFSLIVGVKKFNAANEWIEKVLQERKCASIECSLILSTFVNILKNNYNSLDNHFGIVLVFQTFLEKDFLLTENKGQFFKKITSNAFPIHKSDFLNIVELYAYDLLIVQELISNSGDYQMFKSKIFKAEKRIEQFSFITFYFVCFLIFATIVWLYYQYDSFKDFIQSFEAIFGFLGVPGMIVMFWQKERIITFLKTKFNKFLMG